MPYAGEKASKVGHADLIRNPDVQAFLADCAYLRSPSDEEAGQIASSYQAAPAGGELPRYAMASDASAYSEPIDGQFPISQVGYVKASMSLIRLDEFEGLRAPNSRFVDPFELAKLHHNADSFSFSLPGSNIRYKNAACVKDGFRRAVWEQLSDERTRFSTNTEYSVRGTLLALDGGHVSINTCPACSAATDVPGTPKFIFAAGREVQRCPDCGAEVYLTDSLRLHEQITDHGNCTAAITRFMNAVEHLLMATFVRMLAHAQPATLAEMALILDGPLAVFGQPAYLSSRFMRLYHQIGEAQRDKGYRAPVILGLQKTGAVMEHAKVLERYLPDNSVRVVDDAYRSQYITAVNNANFGHETYFGQDFIFKTRPGRIFVLAVPYPFEAKRGAFSAKKVDLANYGDSLARALDVVRYFELDLYQNAIVPIALAHRHASISVQPGGKALDFLTRNGLTGKS